MIFISLGTQKFQFNRLLQYVDELIKEGVIKETVFAQIGNSTYIPENYEYSSFLSQSDFENKINKSTIFLTHGGVGSITTGLKYGKKVIVFPRLSKYNEHIDDHQTQITKKYAELGYVLIAETKDEIKENLDKAKFFESQYVESEKDERVLDFVKKYIEGGKN